VKVPFQGKNLRPEGRPAAQVVKEALAALRSTHAYSHLRLISFEDAMKKRKATRLLSRFERLSSERKTLTEKNQKGGTLSDKDERHLTALKSSLKRIGSDMFNLAEIQSVGSATKRSIKEQLWRMERVHQVENFDDFEKQRLSGGPGYNKGCEACVLETRKGPKVLTAIFTYYAATEEDEGRIQHQNLPGKVGRFKNEPGQELSGKENVVGFYTVSAFSDGAGLAPLFIPAVGEKLKDEFVMTTVSPARGFKQGRDMNAFFKLSDDQKICEVLEYLASGKDLAARTHLANGGYVGHIHFNPEDPVDPVTVNYVYPREAAVAEQNKIQFRQNMIALAPHLKEISKNTTLHNRFYDTGVACLSVPANANQPVPAAA